MNKLEQMARSVALERGFRLEDEGAILRVLRWCREDTIRSCAAAVAAERSSWNSKVPLTALDDAQAAVLGLLGEDE